MPVDPESASGADQLWNLSQLSLPLAGVHSQREHAWGGSAGANMAAYQ